MANIWKNRLQEYCQLYAVSLPKYDAIDHGPNKPHIRWDSKCKVGPCVTESDTPSKSKGEAEQKAAKLMYELLCVKHTIEVQEKKPQIVATVSKLPPLPSVKKVTSVPCVPCVPSKMNIESTNIKQVSKKPPTKPVTQTIKTDTSRSRSRLQRMLAEDGLQEPQYFYQCILYLPNGQTYRSEEYTDPKRAEESVSQLAFDSYE